MSDYPMMQSSTFRKYCRQKGTRIDAILTDIEKGLTNLQIAQKYYCSERTIWVYRKALEGKLSKGSDDPSYPTTFAPEMQITDDKDRIIYDGQRETFKNARRIPYVRERLKIIDMRRIEKVLCEASGEKTLKRAEAAAGLTTDMLYKTRKRGWITVVNVCRIHQHLKVNLFELGLVELNDEWTSLVTRPRGKHLSK